MPITGSECEEAVYSEAYIDYIADYTINAETFRQMYDDICVQYINDSEAAIYERYSGEEFLINKRGYRAFPKCYGLLDNEALVESGILRLRRQPFFNLTGQGVLVAVIDTGIDFRHPAFVQPDNTTKIVAAWNQADRSGEPPEGIIYGTEYTREDINRALAADGNNGGNAGLQADSSFNAAGLDGLAYNSEHGTSIAGIAAGREVEEADFSGAAPLAELVIVKLKEAKQVFRNYYRISDNATAFQENDVMLAVTYVLNVARRLRRPIVICMGIGTNQGDHNGLGPLSDYLNLITLNPGVYVCTAAGNETGKGHHFRSNVLTFDEYQDVDIYVGGSSGGFTAELWGGTATLFAVAVKPPIGEFTGLIEARFNEKRSFNFLLSNTILEISAEIFEGSSGDELLFFRFINPAEGLWTIRVFQKSTQPGIFDMWLPMEDFLDGVTVFLSPDPDVTICEPGNTTNVITFAGSSVTGKSLYVNSSRGFTRSGRVKPDITAPAVGVYTAVQNGRFEGVTGTSMAAGIGSGAVALIAEWSLRNTIVSNATAKKYLIRGADREGLVVPDTSWGWGRLDLYSSFVSIGE